MKQFLILSLVLCLSAAVFSSCNNEDNTPEAPSISFKDNTDGTFYAKAGFPLTLTPQVENGDGAQYSWTLGGQQVGTSATYTFQSDETGTYALTLTVKTAGGEATQQLSVTVEPVDVHYRPATQNSLAACNAVYEYTPAPGQFINEPQSGFKNEKHPEAACAYALERMGKSAYVSLGGFGGYLIVGFDHSIYNEKRGGLFDRGKFFLGQFRTGNRLRHAG
ncbi:MAG: PKD-like domain-containing protein [Alistipes indistinctus]